MFKYNLLIKGSKEQLQRMIIRLKYIGYDTFGNVDSIVEVGYSLITNKEGRMWTAKNTSIRYDYLVVADHESLVLALAAATNSTSFMPGEWLMGTRTLRAFSLLAGKMYQRTSDPNRNVVIADGVPIKASRLYFRRATAEEIFEYFKQKPLMKEEKKIVGYKIIKLWPLTTNSVGQEFYLTTSCPQDGYYMSKFDNTIFHENILKEFPDFFEPIYEKTRIERSAKVECEEGDFWVTVSADGIYYATDKIWLDVDRMKSALEEITARNADGGRVSYQVIGRGYGEDRKMKNFNVRTIVTHIDFGCKKKIPIADYKKVLAIYDSMKAIHDEKVS